MHIATLVTRLRARIRHGRHAVADAGPRQSGTLRSREPVLASHVANLVRDARRVVLASTLPVEERVWGWLKARPSLTEGVWLICPESADPAAVMPLVERGFRVSCVRDMDLPMLILDTCMGWTLPDLRPLRDPSGMAERWRLRRVGLYTRLSGTIDEHIPSLHVFHLRERPDIWFNAAPDIVIPPPGTAVVVLAHWTPWTWRGDHLRLVACSVQPDLAGQDRPTGSDTSGG